MAVLVLAADRDPTADRVGGVLADRGIPVVRVDTAHFPERASIDAEFRNGAWTGTLRMGETVAVLEEVRSIWYRSPGAFEFPDELSPTERRWAMTESELGLGGVLTALPGAGSRSRTPWPPTSRRRRVASPSPARP